MPKQHTKSSIATVGQPIKSARTRSVAPADQHEGLADRSRAGLGRPVTLDDIPDEDLDNLASPGFDWIWLFTPGNSTRPCCARRSR